MSEENISMSKTISIIVPVYNEEENLYLLTKRLEDVLKPTRYPFEIIFIDDGSTDNSVGIIKEIASAKSNVSYILFSRNFGKDHAISAGLLRSKGDAVVTMDADLQHPPELILQMLEIWEEGNEVIYTYSEEKNIHAKGFNQIASRIFYHTINKLSDLELEDGLSDFRLLDKKVVTVLNRLSEDEPFFRGLVKWVGFKQVGIPYTPHARIGGESKYSKKALTNLAIRGITSFSVKPLGIAVYIGFIIAILSILYVPYAIYSYYAGFAISGWASIIVTIAFFGGLQLIILGTIGIYLGKVFMQTKQRPHYIIKETNIL